MTPKPAACFLSVKGNLMSKMLHEYFFDIQVTEWPPIGKIAAHSVYDMFSWYKYLIVSLFFPTLVFGVGTFF